MKKSELQKQKELDEFELIVRHEMCSAAAVQHIETVFNPTTVHIAMNFYCREKLKIWKEFFEKQNT